MAKDLITRKCKGTNDEMRVGLPIRDGNHYLQHQQSLFQANPPVHNFTVNVVTQNKNGDDNERQQQPRSADSPVGLTFKSAQSC